MTEIEKELYHYGVPGMKWGKRKDKYVTVRQGLKNARAAGQDAWRKSVSDNGGKLVGKSKQLAVYKNPADKFRGKKAARTAYNDAYKESIQNDKAYNKQLRSENKTVNPNRSNTNNKGLLTDTQKKKLRVGAAVTATALAAYGGYKVNEYLNSCSYTVNGKSVSRKEFAAAIKTVARGLS